MRKNRSFDVHRLPECPLQYYTSYLIPRNFPFERELNLFIMRAVENGFFVKWGNDVIHYDLNNKSSALLKIFQKNDLKTSNRTFSLEDVEIAFFILILGFTASVMTFAGEVWYNRKKRLTLNRTLMEESIFKRWYMKIKVKLLIKLYLNKREIVSLLTNIFLRIK